MLIKNQSENPFNIVSGHCGFQDVASKYQGHYRKALFFLTDVNPFQIRHLSFCLDIANTQIWKPRLYDKDFCKIKF